jgi:hypothetical protein
VDAGLKTHFFAIIGGASVKNIDIRFTVHDKLYRIRTLDKRNLTLERKAPKRWVNEGYHNAYSLRFAILAVVTQNIKGDLMQLFREQNRLLDNIERQINNAVSGKG